MRMQVFALADCRGPLLDLLIIFGRDAQRPANCGFPLTLSHATARMVNTLYCPIALKTLHVVVYHWMGANNQVRAVVYGTIKPSC